MHPVVSGDTFVAVAGNNQQCIIGTSEALADCALLVVQDLFDSIAAGDYPEWKLMIQTMEVADEDKFDFDPLDDTKTWPEDIFPLQPVGRMVLNKNPDNFFNENEQVAYCPALIVPGMQRAAGTLCLSDMDALGTLLTVLPGALKPAVPIASCACLVLVDCMFLPPMWLQLQPLQSSNSVVVVLAYANVCM